MLNIVTYLMPALPTFKHFRIQFNFSYVSFSAYSFHAFCMRFYFPANVCRTAHYKRMSNHRIFKLLNLTKRFHPAWRECKRQKAVNKADPNCNYPWRHKCILNNCRWTGQYSDSRRVGRSGDRIPVEARFSAPVQTGSDAHPASYTMGTGSFPGVKRPGRGVDHPPNLAPMLKKE
jgi:hypothetical protein